MSSIIEEAMSTEKQNVTTPEFSEERQEEVRSMTIFDYLRISTGPGGLEEYKESPLNFARSEGLARIIRGLAGFIGADVIRSAIVDILIGVLQFVRERRNA